MLSSQQQMTRLSPSSQPAQLEARTSTSRAQPRSGTPHQITATDGSGSSHDFIFIAEIADGKLGHSIEALDTPGQPISRED